MGMQRENGSRLVPCRQARGQVVWEMGGGFAGVALSALLSADSLFAAHAGADRKSKIENRKSSGPLAPKTPHFPTRVKSVIFLMMNGAPSHIDTFDYKPSLKKYAGQELPPSFQFTNSGGRKKGC